MRKTVLLSLAAVVVLAWVSSSPAAAPSLPSLKASGATVATCDSSMRGIGIPLSEKPTKTVSAFGIFEFTPEHRDLRRHPGSLLKDKAPIGILGDVAVTVSVPARMRHRVALAYVASGRGGRYAEIEFLACPHKARTVWPGGLVLRDRQPVKLLITVAGERPRPLWLGRD